MTTERTPRPHPSTRDLPLPGHYGVLTAQLNVTRYHPSGQVRWVLVVREPSDQIEISRGFKEIGPDGPESDMAILEALSGALTEMLYLQTGISRAEGVLRT